VAEHPFKACCLDVERDRVAVDEGVVDDGFALLASFAATFVEPDPWGEAVLLRKRHRQVVDIGAAAVGEAVPVEVCGCQSRVDHRVDLCAQLAFDVGQLGLCEECCALRGRVDVELVRLGVEQRGDVGFVRGRAPAMIERIAAQ
jgi:hypothetical protein